MKSLIYPLAAMVLSGCGTLEYNRLYKRLNEERIAKVVAMKEDDTIVTDGYTKTRYKLIRLKNPDRMRLEKIVERRPLERPYYERKGDW